MTYATKTERQRARQSADRRRREREGFKISPVAADMARSSGAIEPPVEVLFERDHRLSQFQELSLTSQFNGDPTPGRRLRMAELEQERKRRLWAERKRKWAQIGTTALMLLIAACSLAAPANAMWPATQDYYAPSWSRSWLERHARAHRPDPMILAKVTAAAFAAGVPVALARAVVRIESGFDPGAISPTGALGLGQILCGTARGLGFSGRCHELRDPDVNLHYAMRYLKMAIDKGGAGCAGVSLYNRGIAGRPVCTRYGRIVLARE